MQKIKFQRARNAIFGHTIQDIDYWVNRNMIPIGSRHSPRLYKSMIPAKDVIKLPFDAVDTPLSSRRAMNILILGGSGDRKSQLVKMIWSILSKAKYYNMYFDPVGTESGRASIPWARGGKFPQYLDPFGIKLKHFMPVWGIDETFAPWEHHFHKYSTRLNKINLIEMWMALGMTYIGASNTVKIIKRYNQNRERITLEDLRYSLAALPDEEQLASGSREALLRVLRLLEDFGVIDDMAPELDLLKEWKEGHSVCISPNLGERSLMCFDCGQKIRECANLFRAGNRVPIMIYLDDPRDYAKENKFMKFNFAVSEILRIGVNYRKMGIYNVMAVQDLDLIDKTIAGFYPIKLISPAFRNVNALSSINIPQKAINYLKKNRLVVNKKTHEMQYVMVDDSNNVVPFFMFPPPCNHLDDIYHPRHIDSALMEE